MTLNGSFLDSPQATMPETPPPATSPLRLVTTAPPSTGSPLVLLAQSMQRQVDQRERLDQRERHHLARNYGLALAALCGVGSTELARGIKCDTSTVRKIVRRVCTEAGIERGVSWDG